MQYEVGTSFYVIFSKCHGHKWLSCNHSYL